jgi:hypothetical protein
MANPPTVCKVRKITPVDPETQVQAGCISVTVPWLYVVLSDNPDSLQAATVSWASGQIPVSQVEGNDLILRGQIGDETVPDTVEVKFEGCPQTSESVVTEICIPDGC